MQDLKYSPQSLIAYYKKYQGCMTGQENSCKYTCDSCEFDCRIDQHEHCRAAIDLLETVDVVRHGKWSFDSYTAKYGKPYRCSECGEEHADTYEYCPDCGAKMDKK